MCGCSIAARRRTQVRITMQSFFCHFSTRRGRGGEPCPTLPRNVSHSRGGQLGGFSFFICSHFTFFVRAIPGVWHTHRTKSHWPLRGVLRLLTFGSTGKQEFAVFRTVIKLYDPYGIQARCIASRSTDCQPRATNRGLRSCSG